MDDQIVQTLAARFLAAAQGVLDGSIHDIRVRALGSAHLFNAMKTLTFAGYNPVQELCKGLICRIHEGRLEILAPCFPKFYNLGERPELDAQLMDLLADPAAVVHFPEKVDGTCIRLYVHPDTGAITAATRGMPDGSPGDSGDEFADARRMHFGETALALAQEQHPAILDPAVLNRYTPVFELLHPQNRIITNYGDRKELVLLAVFDKTEECRELTRLELETFARTYALHLVDTLAVTSTDWDTTIATLHAQWNGTDREGTVVTVERGGEIVLRVKVKSPAYLAVMRALNHCTIGHVEALIAQWGSATWEEFRGTLTREIPLLPEESLPSFERYFQACMAYEAHIGAEVDAIVAAYEAFVTAHGAIEEQKAFALLVKNRPDAAHFFQLRKHGDVGRAIARDRIAEALRKHMTVRQFARLPDDDAA